MEEGKTKPFVGMGLTYFVGGQAYAGTVVRITDDLQGVVFVGDEPHPPRGRTGIAFIFTPGCGPACEARWSPEGYVWNGRPIVLGSRCWRTEPTVPPAAKDSILSAFRERLDRVAPRLLQRSWPPMSYMAIPSLLRSADELLAEMGAYGGPDEAAVRVLRDRLATLRAGFRRDV